MFGKKKITKQDEQILPSQVSESIHTMPTRFHMFQPKKGKGMFIFLFTIIVILLITLIVLAVFYKDFWTTPVQPINTTNTTPLPTPTPTPTLTPTPTPPSTPTSTPTPTPSPSTTSAYDNSDIDIDGLTGEEEKLFFTNANNPDTDSDGYKDEEEILYGFDPRLKGRNLDDSDLVAKFSFHGSTLLYPSPWYVKEAGSIVIFDTKTSETIGITYTVFDQNMNKEGLLEWVKKDDPMLSNSDIEETSTRNAQMVYKTKDGMKYYIFSNDFKNAFVLSYNGAGEDTPLYLSTFRMMVNSLSTN